ncbi:MAG: TonB-dependent receptor [Alistipes sp.]|nr:TonB-dependent receptor [Candidatus Alistipes equi]
MIRILAYILLILAQVYEASAESQKGTSLYIVNGVVMNNVQSIPEDNIEKVEMLEASEENIAKYGEKANNGVIIITLKYDKEARFLDADSLEDFIYENIKWDSRLPVAKFSMRYTILPGGKFVAGKILENTDRRLQPRIMQLLKRKTKWQAATKQGQEVESDYVLNIQVPRGKKMPKEPYIVVL